MNDFANASRLRARIDATDDEFARLSGEVIDANGGTSNAERVDADADADAEVGARARGRPRERRLGAREGEREGTREGISRSGAAAAAECGDGFIGIGVRGRDGDDAGVAGGGDSIDGGASGADETAAAAKGDRDERSLSRDENERG